MYGCTHWVLVAVPGKALLSRREMSPISHPLQHEPKTNNALTLYIAV